MENLINRIQTIFREKFNLEIPAESFEGNISLGAAGIGFDAIYMYYFIDFVEKEFAIEFTSEQITSGQIRTLSGVCRAVKELQPQMAGESKCPV